MWRGGLRASVGRLVGAALDQKTVRRHASRAKRVAPWLFERSGIKDEDRAREAYFQLLSAFYEMGETERARECAELAIKQGLWREYLHMPRHFMPSIPDRHLHDPKQFWFVDFLQTNYSIIRSEFEAKREAVASAFKPVKEQELVQEGAWSELVFYQGGVRFERACSLFPETFRLLQQIPEVANGPGAAAFSVLRPGTRVIPHCGPTNTVLRVHLGIMIPPGCGMRVKHEELHWKEGECLVFDHSYEHEVWNRGGAERVVLLFDVFHPSLTEQQRKTLPPELFSLLGVTEKFMRDRQVERIERQPSGMFNLTPDSQLSLILGRYFDGLGLKSISFTEGALQLGAEASAEAVPSKKGASMPDRAGSKQA